MALGETARQRRADGAHRDVNRAAWQGGERTAVGEHHCLHGAVVAQHGDENLGAPRRSGRSIGDGGALAALPRGAIHISMSTISPALSRRLSERHRASGQTYVAAPVFGRPEAAEAKKLWVVAAGPAPAIERCRPLFDAMGQGTIVAGEEPARSNVIKLAGNFLIAAAIEAMGEAFAFGRKHGIAPAELLDVVNGKLFRSPIYENYGKLIADERYEPAGFKLKYGLKDVRLTLAAAEEVAAPMPVASVIRDHYLSGVARGWQDIDWAALARIASADAGL